MAGRHLGPDLDGHAAEPRAGEHGADLGFNAFDGTTGDMEPAGKFTSGTATVTVAWGAGNGVTNPGSYRLQEQNLHGWTRVGSLPADGTSGSVTYTTAVC